MNNEFPVWNSKSSQATMTRPSNLSWAWTGIRNWIFVLSFFFVDDRKRFLLKGNAYGWVAIWVVISNWISINSYNQLIFVFFFILLRCVQMLHFFELSSIITKILMGLNTILYAPTIHVPDSITICDIIYWIFIENNVNL